MRAELWRSHGRLETQLTAPNGLGHTRWRTSEVSPVRKSHSRVRQRPAVIAPIVGVTKPHHLQDAVASLQLLLLLDDTKLAPGGKGVGAVGVAASARQ